jgi:hypothetical protein
MANKYIKDIDGLYNLDNNFFIPGVKGNDSNEIINTNKFNLSSFDEKLDKITNSLYGDLRKFNSTDNYFKGEYVVYSYSVYRFINDHFSKNWDINDVVEVSLFSELNKISTQNLSSEIVNIYISFEDDNIDLDSIILNVIILSSNKIISVSRNNQNIFSFSIPKGEQYIIKFPQIAGYIPVDDLTYTSELDDRFINIFYYNYKLTNGISTSSTADDSIDNNTINLIFKIYGNASDNNILNNKKCIIYNNTSCEYYSTIISNNIANFERLPNGFYKTMSPLISGYTIPSDKQIMVNGGSTVVEYLIYYSTKTNLSYISLLKEDDDGNFEEINLNCLFDKNNNWIGERFGVNFSNSKAFHIHPKELVSGGNDYFVKIIDLLNIAKKPIGTTDTAGIYDSTITNSIKSFSVRYSNVNFNTLISGKRNTYELSVIPALLGIELPIGLSWVNSQKFTYKNRVLYGFIGSMAQSDFIIDGRGRHTYDSNKIEQVLDALGYSDSTSSNGYYNKTHYIWTSDIFNNSNSTPKTQMNYAHVPYLANPNEWNGGNRTSSFGIIPFFSL